MRFTKSILVASVLFLSIFGTVQSQGFQKEILEFKKQDSLAFPPSNAILFVGSSSFTKWKDVSAYFPNHVIINRGFGGSTLLDVIHYKKDVISPYNPKQIVIYCGENDIASDPSISGKIVLKRFKELYKEIRKEYPKVSVVFISMKPCPIRWEMRERLMDGNLRIKKFIESQDNSLYVSVWEKMLDADKKPIASIFIKDQLHMNAEGYSIWQKIIEPVLLQ
jgi:lysophospholipase L1-like esterase